MGKTDFNNLGQYFTPENVALFMNSFIEDQTPKGGDVLDPCIGRNVFFKSLNTRKDLKLVGIEIDSSIISTETKKFYRKKGRKLILGDFIKYNFNSKFDSIILNPPYTRQEKITPEIKRILKSICHTNQIILSQKANLYIYFILKSLELLKEGGILVAITYDSWLYSSFGNNFKKYLTNNYDIQRIIHFKDHAFIGVDIGATIMVISKKRVNGTIKYLELDNSSQISEAIRLEAYSDISAQDLENFNDHIVDSSRLLFPINFFQKLAFYSSKIPWRGTSSPSNKYFINKQKLNNYYNPLIKYAPVDTYSISDKNIVYGLTLPKGPLDTDQLKILNDLKDKVINTNGESLLKLKITERTNWFRFTIKEGGNVIFNYYFRNNFKFIYNPNRISTLGNFYNLNIMNNLFQLFALLNSSLTKYAFHRYSKNQGRGLKKIQLYQFNEVPILKLDYFSESDMNRLYELGKELAYNKNRGRNPLIEIDSIVTKRYSSLMDLDYNIIKLKIEEKIGGHYE